jgi:thiol-disulfide isomerase/thioredoxin
MNPRLPRIGRLLASLASLALLVAACSSGANSTSSAAMASGSASPGAMMSAEASAAGSAAPASAGLGSAAPGSVSPGSVSPGSVSPGSAPPSTPAGDALLSQVLTDVRNGQSFTLGALASEQPVLLETMAIWCTNCRAQMHRVIDAHAMADFTSVGLDVDPTEVPDDLKAYVEGQGFDWRFATADAQIATGLREQFGSQVLNPPSTPMILIFGDGSMRALDFGRPGGYSAEELVAEIAAG